MNKRMSSSASSSPSIPSSLSSLKTPSYSNYIRNRGLTNFSNLIKPSKAGTNSGPNLTTSVQSLGSVSSVNNSPQSKETFKSKFELKSISGNVSTNETNTGKTLVEKNIQKFGISKTETNCFNRITKLSSHVTVSTTSLQVKPKFVTGIKPKTLTANFTKTVSSIEAKTIVPNIPDYQETNFVDIHIKPSSSCQSLDDEYSSNSQYCSNIGKSINNEYQSIDETDYRSLPETSMSLENKSIQRSSPFLMDHQSPKSSTKSPSDKSPILKLKESLSGNIPTSSVSGSSSSVAVSGSSASTNSLSSSPSCTSPTSNKSQV